MNKSFTLVELIVVIAIIAILAAIIAPNAFRAIEKSKVAKAVSDFKAIKNACGALYADTGHWPHGHWTRLDHSNLVENVDNWPGWDGPYLERTIVQTPWGGTYFFDTFWNWGRGPQIELTLEIEDCCYNGPDVGCGPNGGCPAPVASARRIDQIIDDGNLSTGEFRGGGDLTLVIQWDFCDVPYCW